MRYLIFLFFVPILCFGQGNKSEINSLIKTLNSKLISESSSVEEKFNFSVDKNGLMQIERTVTAPKLATRKFTYSLNLKDTEYILDSQHHGDKIFYAFVFKDKMVKKNIKQVIKVKNFSSSLPETMESERFGTLIIPLTLDIKEEDIKDSSEAISRIFELAKNENSYASSHEH